MSGLVPEIRAFSATTLKEWRMMRRYPLSFVFPMVWAILLPSIYVAEAHGFSGTSSQAAAAFASRAGTTQVPAFLYLGWTVYLWISLILWGPGHSLRYEKMRGALEMVFLTRTSKFTILFGSVPAYLVIAMCIFATAAVALRTMFGYAMGAEQLLRCLVVILATTPVLFALGALFASVALHFQDFDGVVQAIQGVLTLLCGVTYPLAVLPGWARWVSQSLPPTQAIAGLRSAVLGSVSTGRLFDQLMWLLAAAAIIGVIAMYTFGRSLAAARASGRLGLF
jgi:ABC-2 type transport system permease protein